MSPTASHFRGVVRTIAARLSWPISPREVSIVGLTALVLYFGSFFLLRKQAFFTFFCDTRSKPAETRMISIDVRFFSKSPPVNTFAYWAYWPIHHWLLPHADPGKPFNYCDEFPKDPCYLDDVRGLP